MQIFYSSTTSEDAGGVGHKMAADDLDSGLFNIALSDSEGEDGNGAADTTTTRDRTGQTEEEFQIVKRDYRPKVDNGEVSLFYHAPTLSGPFDKATCDWKREGLT